MKFNYTQRQFFKFLFLLLLLSQGVWLAADAENFLPGLGFTIVLLVVWGIDGLLSLNEQRRLVQLSEDRVSELHHSNWQVEQLKKLINENAGKLQSQQVLSQKARQLAEAMGKTDWNSAGLGGTLMRNFSGAFDLVAGIVYLKENQTRLFTVQGVYALDAALLGTTVNESGFVGEVVRTGEPLVVRNIPSEYIRVESGLGNSASVVLTLLPICMQGEVVAVVELATFNHQHIEQVWNEIRNELSVVTDCR